MKIVVEWNDLHRYLDLPGVPDKGDSLVIPAANGDPERGLILTVATRRWRMTRAGNLGEVMLRTMGGPQPPRPTRDEEARFREFWGAAGWLPGS